MRKGPLFTVFLTLVLLLGLAPVFAQTAQALTVRVGEHDTYDRIVFDWPKNVKYKVQREGGKVSLVFDSETTIKFPANLQTRIRRASSFSAQTSDRSVIVSFVTAKPNAIVQTTENDAQIIVDILDKTAPQPQKAAAETPPQTQPAATTPLPTPSTTGEASTPTNESKADGVPQALLPSPSQKPPVPATSVKTPEPLPQTKQTPPALQVAKPSEEPSIGNETPAEATPKEAKIPKENLAPPPTVRTRKANDFGFSLSNKPTLIALLDPHIETRAVIFLRAGVGYVVLDRKITLPLTELQKGAGAHVDIEPFDLPKNSGFRFSVPAEASLQATLDGTAWKIFLSTKQEFLPVRSALIAQPDFALGARLLLPMANPSEPIRLTDPVVGDDLILVPLAQSQAFNVERTQSNLTILPAAQGLVIKPLSDKLFVRPVSDGIEITTEGGLAISPANDTGITQSLSAKSKSVGGGKSIFDFPTWRGKPNETFTQARQRLQQTIVDVPENERNRARMELARFYFAHGMGEEALSLLNALAKEVPDLRFHSDFMALLGAAKILAYRSEDGLRDLTQLDLADQPEVVLWQAVGLAQLREWQLAEEKFATKKHVLRTYPEPFLSRFFVLAIESALASSNSHEAADWLDFISNAPHEEGINPALAFLRGEIEADAGHAKEAQAAWKEARASNDRLYKVRAELALIDLSVSNGSLTPAQAADRLEALRFGWRGDDLEADILRRLGQFYIQAKNIKTGINVLSRVATLYPSSALTPGVRTEMAKVFREVFLGSSGEKLSPLEALALFRQYRELLPSGEERDIIMEKLAERLVAVDLLDQAGNILEDLAKNRLQGEERQQTVLRLAAIRLLDHRPKDALEALKILNDLDLSASHQNQRVLLHARSLFELHRDTEAQALLKDNPTPDSLLLRVDIAMRTQRWDEAAKILTDLIGPPPSSDESLSPEKAGWLVNAAIAYALANEQVNLDKLAIDYGKAMASQPQNATFQMLTRPEKTGQFRDLASAQAQLSQVDMFQGFLNSYRKATDSSADEKKKE